MQTQPLFLNKKLFFLFFLSAALLPSASAQPGVFKLGEEDPALLKTLYEKHELIFRNTLNTLPVQYKENYREQYKLRWDNLREKFDNSEIYTSADARQYLDALVATITAANPELKNIDFSCYFSRSGIPNASYLGEGMILLNMGLFNRLENESQAVFVLCHELAHLYLHHSENAIRKYVASINSREVQEELRTIRKKEYRKRAQLENLVKELAFDNRRHGRENEEQADSMALEFMKNTGFNIADALTTLNLLDKIDTDSLNTALVLKKMFNAPNYPFQKNWIAKEEGLLGGHARLSGDEFDDSLKTHPDCKLRILRLAPSVKKYERNNSSVYAVDRIRFERLQKVFRYEIIEYAYLSNNYTRSLYYTMELFQNSPSDPYLVAQIGKIMNNFYAAMKGHRLSKVADIPSPWYPSNYNLLLQFVQNLYPENFASISYHFLNRYHPGMDNYLPYKNAYGNSIQIAQK